MLNLPQVYLMSFTAEKLYSKRTEFIDWLLTDQKSHEVISGVTKKKLYDYEGLIESLYVCVLLFEWHFFFCFRFVSSSLVKHWQ